MRRTTWVLFLGLLVFLLGAGWFVFGPAWSREKSANQQQIKTAASPRVTVSHPVVREIVEWEEYTGRLESVETVELRARVNGYLQSVHFNDGQVVKKGDLLFIIDPRPYQAELDRVSAELQLAKARLDLAKSDYARAQKLLQFRAISQEEADTRLATERQAQEAVEAARAAVKAAELNVEFTRITAPISGRIGRKLVTEGNLINGGSAQATLLTTIVAMDPIYAYFEADERSYLRYLRLSQNGKGPGSRDARRPVYLALADEKGFPHKGYADFVDNRLDPNTGTMRIRAVFPNPDLTLTPGLFGRVRLPGTAKYEAVVVPDEAIGSDLSQKFVLIVNEQNVVEQRAVELGPISDGLRVIREGLNADEWVIVNGMQRSRPGLKVEPQKQEISVREAGPTAAGSLPAPDVVSATDGMPRR